MDFGTGDGSFVLQTARARPDVLVVGVDAAVDNLRPAAHRAGRKPARGGVANALFAQLSLADAPGVLAGLADELHVLLPWGGLLRAVATAEPAGLAGLRAVCKPGAAVRFVFGYGSADAAMVAALGLPPADGAGFAAALAARHRAAGFALVPQPLAAAEVGALGTTWAKKLAHAGRSDQERVFWQLSGRCT